MAIKNIREKEKIKSGECACTHFLNVSIGGFKYGTFKFKS